MPKVVTQRCPDQDLNLRPTDRKPKCLTRYTTAPPMTTGSTMTMKCRRTYVRRTRAVPCLTSTAAGCRQTLAGCRETPAAGLTADDRPHHPMNLDHDRLPPGLTAPDWPRPCHAHQTTQYNVTCYNRQLSLPTTSSAATTSPTASSTRSQQFVRPLPQQPHQSSFQGKWCRR